MRRIFLSAIKAFFSVSVILIISAFFTVFTAAADDNIPPVSAVVYTPDGWSYEIKPISRSGEYYLFLPSLSDDAADGSELTLVYNGEYSVYGSDGKTLYTKSETFPAVITNNTVSVKEKIGSTSKTYKLTVMRGGEIPVVYVTLTGGNKAFRSVCASQSNEASGKVMVVGSSDNVIYNGKMTKFKGHGLTSFVPSGDTNRKNSYNINIDIKTELIDGAGKSKKWVLLSPRTGDNGRDTTGISQLAAFSTYSAIIGNSRAGMLGEYVDLYMNGEYRGVYILTERMDEDGAINVTELDDIASGAGQTKTVRTSKNGKDPAMNAGIQSYSYRDSVKLSDNAADITGGYVLEVMFDTYGEVGFKTKNGCYINIKSPDNCSKKMVQYIAVYVQDFEDALFSESGYNDKGKHYTEYVDTKSLADTMLVYMFYTNFEIMRTSTYMYKDADGQSNDKLTFGPAWDFETAAVNLANDKTLIGTSYDFAYSVLQQYSWLEQMWTHGELMSVFVSENERMRDAIDALRGTESAALTSLRDIIKTVTPSQEMSGQRWGTKRYEKTALEYVDAINTRYEHWYDVLWNPENYMLSLNADGKDNADGTVTFTANVTGTCNGKYNWYKVSADKTSFALYNNHSQSITVPYDGSEYFCKVSGLCNAYYKYAAGDIFSNETITMSSNTVCADYETYKPAPPETEAPETEAPEQSDGCNASAQGITIIIMTSSPLAALIIKRKRK